MDKTALTLAIIGALNWGLIGIFGFDAVGAIFGGQMSAISRIIFTLVGVAGLWCITLLFKDIITPRNNHWKNSDDKKVGM